MKSKWFGAIIVAFLDLCMFNLSFWMAYAISVLIYGSKILPKGTYTNIITFANFILLIIFFSLGLYRRKRSLFDSEDFYLLLESVILCYLIITAATFLSKSMDYSRLIVTNTFVISLFMISLARSTLSILLARTMARWSDKQRAAILGRTKIGESILKKLKESPELGYDFVGFMEFNPSLKDELKKRRIQTLFVSAPYVNQEELFDLVTVCDDVEFKIVPDLMELISEPLSFDEFRDIPLITIQEQQSISFYLRYSKRVFDLIASVLLLLILSPLFCLTAAAIKLDSKGPVFFRQKRMGEGGNPFMLYKFRTMSEDAEKLKPVVEGMNEVDGLFKMKDDPRVTRVGYMLRRTCIDELPQLFNILRGEMSLVGPRPHTPEEMKFFDGWRKNRFKVKPGLTGLWQVGGRHEIDFDKAVLIDIYYIKHMSLILDLEILIKTIPSIIYSKGRW